MMSEGRRTSVLLVGGGVVELVVSPRLEVEELLSLVASQTGLRQPDAAHFALAFQDESGRWHWLQTDRRVLDHEFPPKFASASATLVLHHLSKFFPDSVLSLRYAATIHLLFLQARSSLASGSVCLEAENVGRAGALLLQTALGDWEERRSLEAEMTMAKTLPLPPHAEPTLVEKAKEEALAIYPSLRGTSKGHALLQFMALVERCGTWGMHFYEVQDKAQVSWSLGISSKGIAQFPSTGARLKPRRVFHWRSLENIYYRDKKFSIEIHDPRRVVHQLSGANLYEEALAEEPDELTNAVGELSTQVSVSRRSFVPSSVQVFVFYCSTAAQCKTIWQSSIAQHQFYLDRKPLAKSRGGNLPSDPKRESMAQALTLLLERRDFELKTPSSSLPTLTSSGLSNSPTPAQSEEEKAKERQLYKSLQAKKAELEAALRAKLAELKKACVEEALITGDMPAEVRRTLVPGEAEPKTQRRVGTAFTLPSDILSASAGPAHSAAQIQAQIQVQRQIAAAAQRLAADKATNKSVRKKRQRDAAAAVAKLKEMEARLNSQRLSASKPDLSAPPTSKAWPNHNGVPAFSCPTTPRSSMPDLMTPEVDDLDLDEIPLPSPLASSTAPSQSHSQARPSQQQLHHQQAKPPRPPQSGRVAVVMPSSSLPPSPLRSQPSLASLDSAPPLYENIGYKNSLYQSSYRKKQYPTLAPGKEGASGRRMSHLHRTHSEHSLASLSSLPSSEIHSLQPLPDFRTGGSGAVEHSLGAYNIPHQRTSWNMGAVPKSVLSGAAESSESLTSSTASSTVMRYGFGRNVSELARKISGSGLGSAGQSASSLGSPSAHQHHQPHLLGSLDRRLIRSRPLRNKVSGSDLAEKSLSPTAHSIQLQPQPSDSSLIHVSPGKRVAVPPSPSSSLQLRSSGMETVKPYQTSDLIKYSQRLSPHSQVSGSFPRPPPPPYSGPRSPSAQSQAQSSSSSQSFSNRLPSSSSLRTEMATWYDAQASKAKPKTATIV